LAWSTQYGERLNREVKRRAVVGIFPNDNAITRLVGAIASSRKTSVPSKKRYTSLELLATMSDNPALTVPASLEVARQETRKVKARLFTPLGETQFSGRVLKCMNVSKGATMLIRSIIAWSVLCMAPYAALGQAISPGSQPVRFFSEQDFAAQWQGVKRDYPLVAMRYFQVLEALHEAHTKAQAAPGQPVLLGICNPNSPHYVGNICRYVAGQSSAQSSGDKSRLEPPPPCRLPLNKGEIGSYLECMEKRLR
jgi:hypothetical protein